MKETTDWLTDKIEGTAFITKEMNSKYERLRFAQCQVMLSEVSNLQGIKFIYTYLTDLKYLTSVDLGRNPYDQWRIVLKFNQNFTVNKEIIGYTREKEAIKEDKIVIVANSYDSSKRVFFAFTRTLELCSEDTKELF